MSTLLRRFAPCVITTLVSLPLTSVADSDIEEVVVSALRLDTSLQQSGTSISIIDEELIKARSYTYLADAVASASGVTINQNGAFGGQTSIRIRGGSTGQTLVLVDGLPVNETTSPGGGFDFGSIDTLDVARVEILKGPQSTLWGTDAIGGVVNIVSKPSEQTLSGSLSAEAGSFGTQRYAGSIMAGNELGDIRISYATVNSDGISKADEDDGNPEEDGFESDTIALRGGINLGDNARLNLIYRDTDAESEFDSFGAATGVQDGDELSKTENTSAQANLQFSLLNDRLQNTLTYGRHELVRDSFSGGAPSFSSDGERTLLRYEGAYTVSDNQKLSVGIEKEDIESGQEDSEIEGIFALYRIQPLEDVTLSFGLRRDDHDTFGSETVGRIAAAWQINNDLLLHSSWGEGFKAPTIFQTTFFCCGATTAATNLRPEVSEAFDLGVQYTFADGKASIGATVFDQETEDLINFTFAIGGYENLDQVDTTGLEIDLTYQLADAWSLSANLMYLDSDVDSGAAQIRLPEKTADVSLSWRPNDRMQATLIATHNGEEEDSRGAVNAWTRFDLSGRYSINERIEVFARIENLFDKDYQQVFGYGTPERSGRLGFRYSM